MKFLTLLFTLQTLLETITAFIFDAKLFAECANTTIQNIRLYRPSDQEFRMIPVDPSGYDIDVWLGCLEQQDIFGVMTTSSGSDVDGLDGERQELLDGVNDLKTIAIYLNTTDSDNIVKRSGGINYELFKKTGCKTNDWDTTHSGQYHIGDKPINKLGGCVTVVSKMLKSATTYNLYERKVRF